MIKRKIIDYADYPRSEWPPIINRIEAKDEGLKRYFTGKPCKWGHVAVRLVEGGCRCCRKAHQQTPEGKAYQKAYQQTPEYKAYRETPEYKAYYKAYQQTPKCKAREKAYQQTQRYKDYHKAHSQTPERKAYNKARQQTPEYKAREKEYREAKNVLRMLGALSTLSQIEE